MTMRIIVTLFTLLLALTFSGCDSSNPNTTDSNGQPVNLKVHPNRWLFINYWASWCAHCRTEIGEFNSFYRSTRQQALVYGVNYDHLALNELRLESKRLGIDYPVLVKDPSEILAIDTVTSLPVTFVYDPSGKLRHVLQGPQTVASLNAAMQD